MYECCVYQLQVESGRVLCSRTTFVAALEIISTTVQAQCASENVSPLDAGKKRKQREREREMRVSPRGKAKTPRRDDVRPRGEFPTGRSLTEGVARGLSRGDKVAGTRITRVYLLRHVDPLYGVCKWKSAGAPCARGGSEAEETTTATERRRPLLLSAIIPVTVYGVARACIPASCAHTP